MDSFPGITVLRSRLDARGSSPCRSRYSAVSTRSLRLKANRLRLDCHMDILSIGIAYRPPMACACARKGICNAYRNRKLYGYAMRSEEHTSELQSLMRISYAVFCLKKKNKKNKKTDNRLKQS